MYSIIGTLHVANKTKELVNAEGVDRNYLTRRQEHRPNAPSNKINSFSLKSKRAAARSILNSLGFVLGATTQYCNGSLG